MKRILALVLLLALVSSCSLAFAAAQPRASELIVDRFVYAYALGDGKVRFSVDITTIRSVDKLGFSSIELQEKQGSDWETVKSATNKFGYNRINYSYSISYNGTIGNEYRVYVKYYAEDDGVSDTKTTTSSALTAK